MRNDRLIINRDYGEWYQFRILSILRSSVHSVQLITLTRESRYFFNVISKLENLSRVVATVTINLQRQSDRKLLDILLVRYDVWLRREQHRHGWGTDATNQSSKYVSYQVRARVSANLKVKSWPARFFAWDFGPRFQRNIMSRHASRHGDETGYKCNVRPRAHQRAISDDLRAMNGEVSEHASY